MRKRPLKIALTFIIVLILCVVCFGLFGPLEAKVMKYEAPSSDGYTGDFAVNDLLSDLSYIDISPYIRPEHLEYSDGYLYASTHGQIIRVPVSGGEPQLVVDGNGETLGFDIDKNGDIIFCDVLRNGVPGVYRADLSSLPAVVTPVVTEIGGEDLIYPDALTIASDGTIYISEATAFSPTKYGGADPAYSMEYWYHSGTGRVLSYDTGSCEGRVLAEGLSFSNGITLSHDEEYLYVAETNEYSIWKISTKADHAVKNSDDFILLISNLPGVPDNLSQGTDGRYWCGLTAPRNVQGDSILSKPVLRRFLMRLYPAIMESGSPECSTCFSFDDSGNVTEFLMDTNAAYPEITGVCETEDRIYLHTNNDSCKIAYLDK